MYLKALLLNNRPKLTSTFPLCSKSTIDRTFVANMPKDTTLEPLTRRVILIQPQPVGGIGAQERRELLECVQLHLVAQSH